MDEGTFGLIVAANEQDVLIECEVCRASAVVYGLDDATVWAAAHPHRRTTRHLTSQTDVMRGG